MNLKSYTLLVLSSVVFCACNNDENTSGNYPSDGLVCISTRLSDLSLGDFHSDHVDDPTLPYSGTDLSLWIGYGTGDPYYISNAMFTQIASQWSTAKPIYWKDTRTPADIYAYAPYIENPGADPKKIPFIIASDQNKDDAVGLAKSDLVGFAKKGFVPSTELNKSMLDITFKHRLSKLTLAVSFSSEFEPAEQIIEKVILNGTKLNVVYDATTATATATGSSSKTSTIVMHKAGELSYEAILAPQDLAGGTDMVTVYLNGGRQLVYKVATGGHKFDAGNHYSMKLTVEPRGIIEFGGIDVKEWQSEKEVDPGQVTDLLNIKYITIPPTNTPFKMGSIENDGGSDPKNTADERPQHDVTLTGFFISQCEITNAQYCVFLNANKIDRSGIWSGAKEYKNEVLIYDSSESGRSNWGVTWDGQKWAPAADKNVDYADYPVIYVTWFGAKAFANWVGGDLPTEAQWEYACRATTMTPWSGGEASMLNAYAWYKDNAQGQTHVVHTTQTNGNIWELCDMHGNVAEWCNDWYDAQYYETFKDVPNNPLGPGHSPISSRVVRGGSFFSSAQDCRSAYRVSNKPNGYGNSLGFRVVS